MRKKWRSGADPGAGGGTGDGDGAAEKWYDGLPDDLKTEASLTKYDSQEAAHRAHVESTKTLTRTQQDLAKRAPEDAVFVPGEGATEDQVKRYRENRGIPESADKYELQTKTNQDPRHPERAPISINDADYTQFRELCHQNGLGLKQAQALLDFQLGRELRHAQQAAEGNAQALRDANTALVAKYGDTLQAKRAQTDRVIELMAGGDAGRKETIRDLFAQRVFDVELGNNPVFIEAMITMSEQVGSTETLIPSAGGAPGVDGGRGQPGGQPTAQGEGSFNWGHNDGTAGSADRIGKTPRMKEPAA